MITVRVEKANAYTNLTGGIFYDERVDSEDAILLAIAKKTEETMITPANESMDLLIQVIVLQTDAKILLDGI